MTKKIIALLFVAVGVLSSPSFAQLVKKTKTINVVPDNAKIIYKGSEVGTGNYDLTFGKAEYEILKLQAEGYVEKTVKIFKADKRAAYTFQLEPDESWTASEASSDLANKNMTFKLKKGMTADEAWQRLDYYITDKFPDMEVSDKSVGRLRTAWAIQKFSNVTIRTRIEVKQVPGQSEIQYRVMLQSEYADPGCGFNDQCFKQWDRVLKTYATLIRDLKNSLE